jgi:hypothetical protein
MSTFLLVYNYLPTYLRVHIYLLQPTHIFLDLS